MKRLLATAALVAALTTPAVGTAQAQRACPAHCGTCAYHFAIARFHAGDARAVNIARKGGGNRDVVHSLVGTRDFQSLKRDSQRACGCPSWC